MSYGVKIYPKQGKVRANFTCNLRNQARVDYI